MLQIYYCDDCNKYFTYEQMDSRDVDLDDYYGVNGDFNGRANATYNCCPHCDSLNIKELNDSENEEEIVEALNDYENQIYVRQNVAKNIIKMLESKEFKMEFIKSKLNSGELYSQFIINKIKERYDIKDEK